MMIMSSTGKNSITNRKWYIMGRSPWDHEKTIVENKRMNENGCILFTVISILISFGIHLFQLKQKTSLKRKIFAPNHIAAIKSEIKRIMSGKRKKINQL